jgi:hypothetical protein
MRENDVAKNRSDSLQTKSTSSMLCPGTQYRTERSCPIYFLSSRAAIYESQQEDSSDRLDFLIWSWLEMCLMVDWLGLTQRSCVVSEAGRSMTVVVSVRLAKVIIRGA